MLREYTLLCFSDFNSNIFFSIDLPPVLTLTSGQIPAVNYTLSVRVLKHLKNRTKHTYIISENSAIFYIRGKKYSNTTAQRKPIVTNKGNNEILSESVCVDTDLFCSGNELFVNTE